MTVRSWNVVGAAVAAVLVTGCAGGAAAPTIEAAASSARPVVTVHKSATCVCCGAYEDHLEASGFEVVTEVYEDVDAVKDELGVPVDLRSCHTNELDGYLAEGHVPVEALEDLLAERPDVDGIALPGMPAGAPGMPGVQEGPLVVASFTDGAAVDELGRY